MLIHMQLSPAFWSLCTIYLRSEFSPSEYLEYLLSGTDETATLAGVAHHTPGPSQLEADAVHILTQLADKVIQETTEEGAVPSPPNVTSKDLALANPWSILQSLLFSLHSLVGALIQQGRVDLARYYINHGLLTSSQYALRHWCVCGGVYFSVSVCLGVHIYVYVLAHRSCFFTVCVYVGSVSSSST